MGRRRQERVEAAVRVALGEFAAAVEVRLHAELNRSRQTQLALIEAVQRLRTDVAERDAEFARALENVGEAIELAAECMEADRVERRALVDALGNFTRALAERAPAATPELARGERVVGGTVYGGPPPIEIALDDDTAPANATGNGTADGVEVQCRFGSRWVDGFEVFAVVHDDDRLRYRLRRLSDGSVPPQLFDESDVRPKERADQSSASASRTSD